MEDLYDTPPKKLDTFIEKYLQPNSSFLEEMNRAVDSICRFLKEYCFRDASWRPQSRRPRVLKVVKGGSLGKGTALKGRSDADLVLFLDIFKGYTDQERDRKQIIQEIGKRLGEWQRVEQRYFGVWIESTKWENPRVLSFTLQSQDLKIEFDVLPAYNAIDQYYKPDPQVYVELIEANSRPGEFSSCFTELQKKFISRRPTKVKSLIRLVKYWYKKCQKKASLPPKYAMELLAIYAWEHGGQRTNFDMAEGFRTVLWLIEHYQELCIFWTTYYDFENETIKRHLQEQLRKSRPVILDPADPTGNLGQGYRWDLLAQEAKMASSRICSNLVAPWSVPQQARVMLGLSAWASVFCQL
ncbi:2'-5'-oligoadenylate synthase 1-like [Hemicordylus capensis]|uniref:2'-5'-oligoadenylate synthase 1-like n=1 Tax=Hemicordylus capensis TaxID=884348 RepID=UPI0023043181|nr:2'-5'-oligoadenylate synthase 1-like [Hemicordylus capensis]